ncbi:hypothetical protein, partial [Streptosporangium canum]|uniref:hypothetical protein n=1 Tax=Streptosporangium canum TaxID=324952 RepID=UPI0033B7F63E
EWVLDPALLASLAATGQGGQQEWVLDDVFFALLLAGRKRGQQECFERSAPAPRPRPRPRAQVPRREQRAQRSSS